MNAYEKKVVKILRQHNIRDIQKVLLHMYMWDSYQDLGEALKDCTNTEADEAIIYYKEKFL